ncbi:hypothetical protein LCGC14_1610580 [marine sediment metagenome]|uniref:Uncharacterized protein n=1 Tax=marine sediment metagenome TaxID=412755 RepID=A0A0F9KP43_9ZZZZ|nr:hypothetical protein [Candidatus Scalindua sp.]
MADNTPTISPFSAIELGAGIRGGGLKVVWSGLTENDTALPWDGGVMFPNKSAHIEGLTAGDTVVIQGSNDETKYLTLTDIQGGNMSFAGANGDGVKKIEENPKLIRPNVEAGTGVSANITITASRAKTSARKIGRR